MSRNKLKVKRFDDGFTLIEMLVVITILGILMGIAVLGFTGVNRASTIKSCKVDYQSVQSALNSLKNDYPDLTAIGSTPLTDSNLYARSFYVDSESKMLSLVALVGDYAVRSDLSKSYILQALPATTLANWYETTGNTLQTLGYMSPLNDNKTKYLITISGSINSLPTVSSAGDPTIAVACIS